MISERRISQLSDMVCQHILKGNTLKALRIAQYLRKVTGYELRDVYCWRR